MFPNYVKGMRVKRGGVKSRGDCCRYLKRAAGSTDTAVQDFRETLDMNMNGRRKGSGTLIFHRS